MSSISQANKAPQRCEHYTGNKGGECNATERLAHCLRVDFTCPYCGADLREVASIHMDHVFPQVLGGIKSDKNIIACCGSCNCSKKHKLLADFAAGRADMEIVSRVRRIQRRKFQVYLEQANRILVGASDE